MSLGSISRSIENENDIFSGLKYAKSGSGALSDFRQSFGCTCFFLTQDQGRQIFLTYNAFETDVNVFFVKHTVRECL